MNRDEEIRLLHEKLDYYTMEAEDDQFDAEKVVRLLKRLRELEPQIEAELEADKVNARVGVVASTFFNRGSPE